MKISEVAKKVNLSPVTLRYYEKMGLIPPVQRQQGVREYRIEDLNWINFIKCLRQVQIPIKDLKQYTELFYQGKKTKPARRQILVKELLRLENQDQKLQVTIQRLKNKIRLYDKDEID